MSNRIYIIIIRIIYYIYYYYTHVKPYIYCLPFLRMSNRDEACVNHIVLLKLHIITQQSHMPLTHRSNVGRATTLNAFRTLSYISEGIIFIFVGMDALDPAKWVSAHIGQAGSLCVALLLLLFISRACRWVSFSHLFRQILRRMLLTFTEFALSAIRIANLQLFTLPAVCCPLPWPTICSLLRPSSTHVTSSLSGACACEWITDYALPIDLTERCVDSLASYKRSGMHRPPSYIHHATQIQHPLAQVEWPDARSCVCRPCLRLF